MNIELKPCPFCGGKARIRKWKRDGYVVRCKDCGAQGTPFYICEWHDTKYIAQGKAAEAWNRRENSE